MDLNKTRLNIIGREVYTFAGEDAYETHIYRGYLVSLEWFTGARSTEPIMMIRDAKQGHDHGALGICLSSIGKYVDPDTPSNAAPGAFFACVEALPTLGKAQIPLEAKLLLDVIQHFASALILMPPTPRDVVRAAQPVPILDVQITHEETGKTHSEVSI